MQQKWLTLLSWRVDVFHKGVLFTAKTPVHNTPLFHAPIFKQRKTMTAIQLVLYLKIDN